MTRKLVECIPNFSDARRPEVINAIEAAIASVPGVYVLDRHSDLDHNRTVVTFVGSPEAVEEAAFQGISRAADLINLDEHTGEHPRIGATDVVPFVPISGVSMEDCVAMARRLGQRVGADLLIPVYLYEDAATRPERQNLENIRRGQYEALKSEMGVMPEREPDYGPSRVGPAGATVIGARQPLIAFNVYLTTGDVEIARQIAKAVRHSTGGMRYVKALGLLVEGLAQVSMNLTNYRKTPVARTVEFIRREAARYGVGIHHTELVGLIPQDALVDASVWFMQLDQFEPEQILERRLYSALQTASAPALPAQSFLDMLASGDPAPGGGSAAAYAGAMAAALVAMVARVTVGKKKYAHVEAQMQALIPRAEELREKLTAAVTLDAASYEGVMAAFRLPKDTPEQQVARQAAVEAATMHASQVPLEVIRQVIEVLELAVEVVEAGNLNAITDGVSGAALAQAAIRSASLNVRVNLSGLKNQDAAHVVWEELQTLVDRAEILDQRIRTLVSDRGGPALA
jgi:glutamate formiminotransferase / formiminotetrahydrofolate cyclodeaminase